jgi:uncharacterized tellurite resistance protein B-like protein
MDQSEKLLREYNDEEKGAYLGAIASIATADHEATEEEIDYLTGLCESAGLSAEQEQMVIRAATELSGEELKRCLDVLKTSELRFSLLADLISFGKSDGNYSETEQQNVEKIAQYVNITPQQFSLLDKFVGRSQESGLRGEEMQRHAFTDSGTEQQMASSGINMQSLTKGLLGIAGPILLSKLLSGGMRRGRMNMNPFSNRGFSGSSGPGIGSLISMLSGGRGFGSTGSFLSKIFGR